MMTSYMNASFLSSYPRALKLMPSPGLKMACVSVALTCPVLQGPVQGYGILSSCEHTPTSFCQNTN